MFPAAVNCRLDKVAKVAHVDPAGKKNTPGHVTSKAKLQPVPEAFHA